MAKRTITTTTPTQVAHPVRTLLRTLIVAGVGAFLGWLSRQGIDATHITDELADWLTGIAWGLATALAQWVLTLPGVDRVLRHTPIGTGVETEPRGHIPPETGSGA